MIPCFVCGTVPENRGHDRADDCECGMLWQNRESVSPFYFGNDSPAQLQAPKGAAGSVARFAYRSSDQCLEELDFDNFWDLAHEVVTYWTLHS